MKQEIEDFIAKEIAPVLKLHMGGCDVLGFDEKENTVTIRLTGGCVGCPSSTLTLYNGIAPLLEERFPGIQIELG